MAGLWAARLRAAAPRKSRRYGVLALAGGTLVAGVLGLVLVPSPPAVENSPAPLAQSPASPVVKTVEVSLPSLDLSQTDAGHDPDGLLPPGTIVVSTSIQKDQMK